MNVREIIAAYQDLKSAMAAPALRQHFEQLPHSIGLPDNAGKLMMKQKLDPRVITDLIGKYTGVHPQKTQLSSLPDYDHLLNNAISDYGDSDYRQINNVFRSPDGATINPKAKDDAMIMMDAFRPTEKDMVLYRGLNPGRTYHKLRTQDLNNDIKEYGNKAFLSASMDPMIARNFSGIGNKANNFRIMVPSGTPVLPVYRGADEMNYGDRVMTPELEYLLPPDSRYARLPSAADQPVYKHHAYVPETGWSSPDFSSTDELFDYINNHPQSSDMLSLMKQGKLKTKGSVSYPDDRYTDLLLTKPGAMKDPAHVPDSPGVGWLAGMLPLGLLDKYSGDQQQ